MPAAVDLQRTEQRRRREGRRGFKTLPVWTLNSLVGLSTKPFTPSTCSASGLASKERTWTTRGRIKARVFPLPVGATASNSLRASNEGIACR